MNVSDIYIYFILYSVDLNSLSSLNSFRLLCYGGDQNAIIMPVLAVLLSTFRCIDSGLYTF